MTVTHRAATAPFGTADFAQGKETQRSRHSMRMAAPLVFAKQWLRPGSGARYMRQKGG